MKIETIEKYIKFSLANWLNLWNSEMIFDWITFECSLRYVTFKNKWGWTYSINLLELITSKEFIECIARGTEIDVHYIAVYQAIAIYDDKLDVFINDILWLKQN